MLTIRRAQLRALDDVAQAPTRARVDAALRQRQPALCACVAEPALQALVRDAVREAARRRIAYEPDVIAFAQARLRSMVEAACTS